MLQYTVHYDSITLHYNVISVALHYYNVISILLPIQYYYHVTYVTLH